MEGKGAYNRYAKLPAGGAALALPLLEKAVRCVALDTSDQGIVIADYGSSQGKNSMVPMQIAISSLRRRVGGSRPISVFHVDQPSNDFNALFEVLDADPDRYVLDDPNVFPGAIGRSSYESVLPPNSVHLGWCSYAAVWLSRIPTLNFPSGALATMARLGDRVSRQRTLPVADLLLLPSSHEGGPTIDFIGDGSPDLISHNDSSTAAKES